MVYPFQRRNETIEESSVIPYLKKRIFDFLKLPGTKILDGKKIETKFYPYANLGSSIRISSGKLEFKIHSSYLKAQTEELEAVIDLLLYKLLKKPVPENLNATIRKFYDRQNERKNRADKNRKRIERSPKQNARLREILVRLNDSYLKIDITDLEIFWGKSKSKTRLGHYDPAHHMIVINPILSLEYVPGFVLEYIVFHELLHVYFPVTRKRGRNVIHGAEFKIFEKKFPDYKRANVWLKSKFYQTMILHT
ncbi:YgjP-like metallopeptidase domain-containing protein [Leptospira kmetyi]|uniref:YgjP-like metallopeptidase domain-containing protein n=1 Tax=Leptospira kmetyi TaxID=408139 RepID=UPI0003905C9E|nr:YgjP-like metallopeptidase domain-containing protein [Leptospira kmetyi]EQA53020.1 PF01863 family protein [Leptospira kmetyi serovar Malaysia str. Bejo-Iso9]